MSENLRPLFTHTHTHTHKQTNLSKDRAKVLGTVSQFAIYRTFYDKNLAEIYPTH